MRRRWRLLMVVAAALVVAGASALGSVAANAATGSSVAWWPSWLPSMNDNYLWWLAGSIAVVAGSALLAWWAQRWHERALVELIPVRQRPDPWVVRRPAEVQRIVRAVTGRRGGGTVGITTAVHGAGGFGKTTVARLVRADRRVLRRFKGRVFWVTLGRDARRGALVEKVNDLVRRVDASRAQPFTDVRQAAEHLASVLADGPRRLIVLDDVWFGDQLAAFPVAGGCARLVTTRIPSLVAGQAVPVRVDQMSAEQARRVLTADLPRLPAASVEALLVETGRWPLLLRLTNRNLVAQAQSHSDLAVLAADLLQRLRRDGPIRAAGQLPGVDVGQLDINDPDQRSQAVGATIEASAGLLGADDRARLTELAIWVEDETVPVALVATLWGATRGLDDAQTRLLCSKLSDLALLTLTATEIGGTISLHDVVRDYLRQQLGDRLPAIHQLLLDAIAADLPRAPAVPGDLGDAVVAAWWELPYEERYLREHLVEHLLAAGRADRAEDLATDLRWVRSRLDESGPAGPFRDMTTVNSPRAARLGRLFMQAAHLLTPTVPAHSLTDVLHSRVDHDPDWGPAARMLSGRHARPALINAAPLPDLPHPATLRILTGHAREVDAMDLSRDGTRLATAGRDHTVRIWDPVTGVQRLEILGVARWVYAVAVSPDGTWLATAGSHGTVQTWDLGTGARKAEMTGHTGLVCAVAVSPDGSWLATGGTDGTVRTWDPVTGAPRMGLSGQSGKLNAMAVSPDGSWLATVGGDGIVRIWDPVAGGRVAELPKEVRSVFAVARTRLATADRNGTVQIWDAATGTHQADLAGHTQAVNAVVVSPDGDWLATAGLDGTVRIWDLGNGAQMGSLTGHAGVVDAMAVSPDGTWLATAGGGGMVRIWDTGSGAQRRLLTGHTSPVKAMAVAPDGTWLATASSDGTVRIWDPSTSAQHVDGAGHTGLVSAVAVSPDGAWLAVGSRGTRIWDMHSGVQKAKLTGQKGFVRAAVISPGCTWLATGSDDGTVRIWDAATGARRADLAGHTEAVYAAAVSPDGTWLATAGQEGIVRIWDPATGAQRAALAGDAKAVYAAAVSPDGTWLATAGQEGIVRIWDPTTGTRQAELTGHPGRVNALAVSRSGTWLATAGDDGVVRIWDPSSGARWAELTGHTGRVHAMAVSRSGTWLATAGEDCTVRIWDLAANTCAAVMRVERPLRCCAWSPDDRQIAAGGLAGLYRFTVHPGDQP